MESQKQELPISEREFLEIIGELHEAVVARKTLQFGDCRYLFIWDPEGGWYQRRKQNEPLPVAGPDYEDNNFVSILDKEEREPVPTPKPLLPRPLSWWEKFKRFVLGLCPYCGGNLVQGTSGAVEYGTMCSTCGRPK